MAVLLESVLKKSELSAIGSDKVKIINEAIQQEINAHKGRIEGEMSSKFEKLVENIATKFSNQVDKAIVESVNSKIDDDINSKLASVVTGMINVLESAGLYSTEKTKELTTKLREANQHLEEAFKEREIIRSQYNDEKKKNFILHRLSGMRPEVISSALNYFENKDILDVQDEIDDFIEGDFGDLIQDDNEEFSDGLTDITLDQVDDVLRDISSQKQVSHKKVKLESLGKGLNPIKGDGINRNSSLSLDSLIESENDYDNDSEMSIAMNQIENFRDLGYKFM